MRKRELANSYLCVFCMELSMLLKAGITPSEAVYMMKDDERDTNGKAVLDSLIGVLETGAPLSKAFAESGYFPHYLVSMVETGEQTGRLTDTLYALSEHYDRQELLAVSIRNAVMYPAVLLIMMAAVMLILIIKVLPIFNDVFNRLGSRMSPLAESLMRFGGYVANASTVISVILGIIVAAALAAYAIPTARKALSKAMRNLASGGVFGRIASSRFISAMSLATASGLDIEKAIDLASSVGGGSKAADRQHDKCRRLMRSGKSLADALFDSGLISARNRRVLSLGVTSGMTDDALTDIALRTNRDAQQEIESLVGRIEPSLVIITSIMIGTVLLSVMLPLMGIMTAIG